MEHRKFLSGEEELPVPESVFEPSDTGRRRHILEEYIAGAPIVVEKQVPVKVPFELDAGDGLIAIDDDQILAPVTANLSKVKLLPLQNQTAESSVLA